MKTTDQITAELLEIHQQFLELGASKEVAAELTSAILVVQALEKICARLDGLRQSQWNAE